MQNIRGPYTKKVYFPDSAGFCFSKSVPFRILSPPSHAPSLQPKGQVIGGLKLHIVVLMRSRVRHEFPEKSCLFSVPLRSICIWVFIVKRRDSKVDAHRHTRYQLVLVTGQTRGVNEVCLKCGHFRYVTKTKTSHCDSGANEN